MKKNFEKIPKGIRLLLFGVSSLICACLCCAVFIIASPSPKANATSTHTKVITTLPPSSTNTPVITRTRVAIASTTASITHTRTSTITPLLTITKTPSAQFTSTSTATVKVEPTKTDTVIQAIPGLTPSDIKVDLQQRHFNCDPVKEIEVDGSMTYSWNCTRTDDNAVLSVMFWSHRLNTVEGVDATILQFANPSNDVAATFLGYIATFSFLDSSNDQTSARTWVEQNLPKLTGKPGDVQETTIKGIPMQLYGPETARTLEIGQQ